MLIQLLIVCPLVFLAGFVDAIAGGGGLISLPAYIIAGVPVHQAIATNKASSAMGTVVSTTKYAKSGYVKWKFCIPCALMALISAPLGAALALRIEGKVIELLMILILPLVAFYVLRTKKIANREMPEFGEKTYIYSMIASFMIGLYDGFYGPGTGTFLILVLTGVIGLDLNTAAGTTKVINLTSNVAALVTYIMTGKVLGLMGIVAGIFCIAGHYLGARCFVGNGIKIVRPIILVVLAVLFVKVIMGYI